MCSDMSKQTVARLTPFSRNLLRNPCGTEGLNHWKVTNGGSGWRVENSLHPGAKNQTCFVTSYSWCEKSQIVDLLQEGLWPHFLDVHQPIICISDWYGGRQDCGCVYQIEVRLYAADKKTVLQTFTMAPKSIPKGNDTRYHQAYHEFHRYGPGVRYVKFSHRGKDMQSMNGWYGARITNSSVTVKCCNQDPRK